MTFRITADEYDRIHALCSSRGIYFSDIVRSAVNHVLSQDAPDLFPEGATRIHTRIQDLKSRLDALESLVSTQFPSARSPHLQSASGE